MLAILLITIPLLVFGYKNELVLLGDDKIGEVVKTPIKYLKSSQLPTNYDLRPLGLLSSDLNQHIPVYWYV